MILIFENVRQVLEEQFQHESPEFKKGALTTLHLFRHGIKIHGSYNKELLIKELNDQIIDLKKQLDKESHKSKSLRYQLDSILINEPDIFIDEKKLRERVRKQIKAILLSSISHHEKLNKLNNLTSNW